MAGFRRPGRCGGRIVTPSRGGAYACAASIDWVQDLDQTILVNGQNQQSWHLQDVDATIWDLLTLGYDFPKIAAFLAALLAIPVREAGERLLSTMRRWEQAGILLAVDGATRG